MSRTMITFYDLASNLERQAWSVSTWKARFVLNFKKIPYKTEWICGPDLKATFDALPGYKEAIEASGATMYRVPLIVDRSDSGTKIVSDSLLIALYLENEYPSTPRVFPHGTPALQAAWTEMFDEKLVFKFIPLTTPFAIHALRDEREKEYYRKTREAWLKCPLEEYCPVGSEKESKAWNDLWAGLDKVAEIMARNSGEGEGTWVMGNVGPTWADFNIVSAFLWFERGGIPNGWEKVKDRNGGKWSRIMEAMKPYMDEA